MDLSLLFLHRQGLAGRPRGMQARPTCRSQGSSRRSGRFPALPYPPLEQVGSSLEFNCASTGECFPFPFPWGAIGAERERAGDYMGRVS
jgi:hypothetical protein